MGGPNSSRISPDLDKEASNNNNIFFSDETAITSPLLNKDGGSTTATATNSSDERHTSSPGSAAVVDNDFDTTKRPTNAQMLKSVGALLVSAGGALASIASFILVPHIIVYVAGGICLMNFPIVAYKEKKILFLPSRRKEVNRLEGTANMLKSEGDILEEEIEYLLGHISRFGGVEQELQSFAREQGCTIEGLVNLVRANDATMDSMRENLRQKIVQDVIGITINNDKDSKHRIDRVEAKLLALKITVKLEAYGVVFDEDKFLQAVALNPTLWGVAGTVRKLLPSSSSSQNNKKEQRGSISSSSGSSGDGGSTSTASSNKDDMYDMFYMTREDQQRRGSARAAAAVAREEEASVGRRASLAEALDDN